MRCMEESDDSIRRAVLSGDKDAYRVLVARYSQVVFRVAYRITGNESDAEEAVQEAFLRGYQRLANFRRAVQYGDLVLSHRQPTAPSTS